MNKFMTQILAWSSYPTLMVSGVAIFLMMKGHFPIEVASYSAIAVAVFGIIILEHIQPHRQHWQPRRKDWINDSLFLIIVQMLLPKLVVLSFVFATYQPITSSFPQIHKFWPHELSTGAQLLMVFLLADFLRYWLHRLAHTWRPLWRLHAVHHSPKKMYWLNTSRFHPLEKLMQLSLDTLPFMLLGVDILVLSLYYVIYATNGFFQHANIKLKFGWLNYFVSTSELHRWHHSIDKQQSDNNFGNNLIIWDRLFGTYYCPKDTVIGDIGLVNRQYPSGFITQMKTPFIPGIEQYQVPVLSCMKTIRFSLLHLGASIAWLRNWSGILLQSACPARVQKRVLKRILHEQANTLYGKQHGFSKIHDYQQFQEQIPVNNYEHLRDWYQLQVDKNLPAITSKPPLYYAVTSGSTDKPKYLPIDYDQLKRLQKEQTLFGLNVFRQFPQAFFGKILAITSPEIEGHTSHGIPYGAVSGLIGRLTPPTLRKNMLIPEEINQIADYELRYLVILCFGLLERHVTYLAAANPSSLVSIDRLLDERKHILLEVLQQGKLYAHPDVPAVVCRRFSERCKQTQIRRKHVITQLQSGECHIHNIWPNLQLVNTWTGGSCGTALSALKKVLPSNTQILDLGLISSESRITFPLNSQSEGMPNLQHVFFEFVEKHNWENGQHLFEMLHELKNQTEYYIFVTTGNGLYRYCMNDIVRVCGKYKNTPLFNFVQKGQGITNISGEKLYEHQVISAVTRVQQESQVLLPSYVMIADVAQAKYRLFIDGLSQYVPDYSQLATQIDRLLCNYNIEYKSKRYSKRLEPLEISVAPPGLQDRLKRYAVDHGQREGQYKPRILWYQSEFPEEVLQQEGMVA